MRHNHVYLHPDCETITWRGQILCLLCHQQFGLVLVIDDPLAWDRHRLDYHVVLPAAVAAEAGQGGDHESAPDLEAAVK